MKIPIRARYTLAITVTSKADSFRTALRLVTATRCSVFSRSLGSI